MHGCLSVVLSLTTIKSKFNYNELYAFYFNLGKKQVQLYWTLCFYFKLILDYRYLSSSQHVTLLDKAPLKYFKDKESSSLPTISECKQATWGLPPHRWWEEEAPVVEAGRLEGDGGVKMSPKSIMILVFSYP